MRQYDGQNGTRTYQKWRKMSLSEQQETNLLKKEVLLEEDKTQNL
jgi:hypothetical protein